MNKGNKVQKGRVTKKAGPSYQERVIAFNKLLEAQTLEFSQYSSRRQSLACKELVLVDILRHQEALSALLQQDWLLNDTAAAGSSVSCLGATASIDASAGTAARANSPSEQSCCLQLSDIGQTVQQTGSSNHRPFASLPGDSWVAQLFRNTTCTTLQRVKAMTREDWVAYYRQLFPKLAVLLEVVSHASQEEWLIAEDMLLTESNTLQQNIADPALGDSCTHEQQQGQHRKLPASSARTQQQSGLPQHLNPSNKQQFSSNTQQQLPACVQTVLGCSDSRKTSAVGTIGDDGYVPGACLAHDIQQLNDLVDELTTLMLLAGVFNPMPVFEACALNLATGEDARATPAARQLVANRLRLTPQQAQHFAVALAEFQRVSRDTSAQGAELLDKTAKTSALIAIAAQSATGKATAAPEAAESAAADSAALPEASIQQAGSVGGAGSGPAPDKAALAAAPADGLDCVAGAPQQQEPSSDAPQGDRSSNGVGHDTLDHQLGRHMLARRLQHMAQHMLIANTLTRLQSAALMVASYPHGPIVTAVVEAVQKHMHQREAHRHEASRLHADDTAGSEGYWEHVQQRHDQKRASLLKQQQLCWWQELRDNWGYIV